MNILLHQVFFHLKTFFSDELGQDLVEYALVMALIALGTISGMKFLAAGLNRAFSQIAIVLTSNII